MKAGGWFLWRSSVTHLLICMVVMLECGLVLVGARPRGQQRMNRDTTEVTVRREPLSNRRSEMLRLRAVVDQLASSFEHVAKDVQEIKTELHGEIKALKELLNTREKPEMKCRTAFTAWAETIGRTLEYLDSFDVHCLHGEFLRQWRMTWGERGNQKAVRFVCCRFTDSHERQNTNSGRSRLQHSGRRSSD